MDSPGGTTERTAKMEKKSAEEDEKEEREKKKRKRDKKRPKGPSLSAGAAPSSASLCSSSSLSSASSSDREDDHPPDKEVKGKVPLKIDTEKLLHTDTMPKETIAFVPESPPIEIETVGVRRDKICAKFEEKTAKIREESGQTETEEAHSIGGMANVSRERGREEEGQNEEEEEYGEEEEEEDFQQRMAFFSRLDAILEEDSDELRSAQSSRASTARQQSQRPTHSPPTKTDGQQQQHQNQQQQQQQQQHLPHFAHPFQFVFTRRLSTDAFSLSSGAKVDEVSTPEEENVGDAESARDTETAAPPKVPPLKLGELSPEGKTPSETGTYNSSSDTDTVLIREEEKEEQQKRPIPVKMFHLSPADADRDQSELVEAMTDQQITSRGTPPTEFGVRSPSMSINLDRSRESEQLDHSICSDPQLDESLMAASLIAAHKRAMGEEEEEEETPRAKEEKQQGEQRRRGDASARERATLTPGEGWERHERQSSTSSSVELDEEKDELPPPPPPMAQKMLRNGGTIPREVQRAQEEEEKVASRSARPFPTYPHQHRPIQSQLPPPSLQHRPIQSHLPPPSHLPLPSHAHPMRPPPPPPALPPVSKVSVTPLWGRNERLVNYLHGYGTLLGKNTEEKENMIVGLRRDQKMEEEEGRQRGADEWTVHPIMLKEDSTRSRAEERVIPIQRKTAEETTPWRGSPLLSSPRRISTEWTGGTTRNGRRNAPMATDPSAHPPPSFYSSTLLSKPNSPFDRYSRDSSSPRHDPSHHDVPFLMSSSTANFPRSSVRDIPIQRSASAFAPMFGGAPGGAPAPLHSSRTTTTAPTEYYRREVLTRTLVTRSTEALSAPPPLGRSSPAAPLLTLEQLPPLRDETQEEYWLRYSRNIEEEERRVRDAQERRKREEEERRKRVEEQRRRWEQQEVEQLERIRRERERMEQALEAQAMDRDRTERDRISRDRAEREAAEKRRREEWERIERERRQYEETELDKRRELERLERERLERERAEAERMERERLEALRREQERLEQQRLEQERVERERLEIERLEIERIERIKREQREKEERDRERAKQEAERLTREREELERMERERVELERQAMELLEKERREEEERERERRAEAMREARRREEELREREVLERAEREVQEREAARRARERAEQERLEALRREQEKLEQEQLEAERRERERQEEERRERELLEASLRAKERREIERLEEEERERQRLEEERREKERRERERLEAMERERLRQLEEQRERDRLAALEASAIERRALRAREEQRAWERAELDRRAEELREQERRERERRDRERQEEERRLAELREAEHRNAGQRERERREAQEREERRRQEDWRSRERLEQLVRERDERERWEAEKRRLLSDYEQEARKRQALTSKETLERLTRKPYYSRENLTQLGTGEPTEFRGRGIEPPEVTTKVERQVIERVDRTLWTEPDTMRVPGGLPPMSSAYFGNTGGILPSLLDASEESTRERIYNPRDEDFLRRGGSQRTSKYRARMEKARKEFLQGSGSGAEPFQPSAVDPVSERFRKSTEELARRRVEYRGPLLQRFNSGEFAHPPTEQPMTHYATGLGRSPYEQEEHRRSRSVLDYSPRQSRRGMAEQEAEAQHSRSKSADYLTDPRRPRDEHHIPENDLQKSVIGSALPPPSVVPMGAPAGEHELRFRKSTERIQMPEWYRDYHQPPPSYQQQQPPTMPSPMTTATSGIFSAGGTSAAGMIASRPIDLLSASTKQPWAYMPPPPPFITPGSPPVGGIAFPPGMFDKYKNEIEDMRRSRTSLHQLSQPQQQQEHTKVCAL